MPTLLGGCASSDKPDLARAELPKKPPNFGKPVDLRALRAELRKGGSLRNFGLGAYSKVLEANRRLLADDAFWDAVEAKYGKHI